MAHSRQETVTTRRMVRIPDHPIAPAGGLFPESRLILYDKIGSGPHPCHYCGRLVDWNGASTVTGKGALIAEHVDGDHLNDAPENLVPSCQSCNLAKGPRHIRAEEVFRLMPDGRRLRGQPRNCETCGVSFVAINSEIAAGKGRFCSMSCARRAPRS